MSERQSGLDLVLLTMALLGCSGKPVAVLPAPDQAQALIGPEEARFVFPEDTTKRFRWHVPTPDGKPLPAEYSWEVVWWTPAAGQVPDGIWAWVEGRVTRARTGDLSRLVAEARTAVMTSAPEYSVPLSRATYDTNVTAHVQDRRVVITVRGEAALRRIFPSPPGSVSLVRTSPQGRQQWNLSVERTEMR